MCLPTNAATSPLAPSHHPRTLRSTRCEKVFILATLIPQHILHRISPSPWHPPSPACSSFSLLYPSLFLAFAFLNQAKTHTLAKIWNTVFLFDAATKRKWWIFQPSLRRRLASLYRIVLSPSQLYDNYRLPETFQIIFLHRGTTTWGTRRALDAA